jgi:hypothetical protein
VSSERTQSAQEASGSTLPAAFLRATKLRVSMLIVFILPCAIGPLAAPANLILGWRLKLGRFFCDRLCDHLLRLLAAGAAAAQPPEAAHPPGRPVLASAPEPNRKQKPLGLLLAGNSWKKQKPGPKEMEERTDLERWCWDRADVGRAGAAVRGRCS